MLMGLLEKQDLDSVWFYAYFIFKIISYFLPLNVFWYSASQKNFSVFP